ncbi:MAG TPA: glycosyltransferase [Lacisediminihabitans sp.]|uniref:glycosyltransferase n=1 Tax=Lacisediminihabitans sp. TaxID=2787631 RepID=UPI002ED89F39
MVESRPGVVSVVLVNFRGADLTIEAVNELRKVDWPEDRLEVVVVENASGDGSAQLIREAAPWVKLVESAENLGFAGGCNLGVANSTGEFVGFLNSDAKPDAQWIGAAVDTFAESPQIGAVASKVLDWDGGLVDYIDSAMTWFGMGYKPFVGERVPFHAHQAADVLFGTGSAMFVRRDVFDRLGGFDERFFMFFEDVDLGWRLNLLGYRYRYQPLSVAFHKHHGSVSKFGSFKEDYFLERNALFALYKNLEQAGLDQALPGALSLSIRRGVSKAGNDSTEFDFRSSGGDDDPAQPVSKELLASVYAIDQFVQHLPSLTASRDQIQATRVVSDRAIWSLFRRVDAPSNDDGSYLEGYENIVQAFEVLERPELTKVLVITGDPIGAKMAGPAIRAWHMAEALAARNEVRLVTMSSLEPVEAPFGVVHVRAGDNRAFEPLEAWADVIVFQGHAMQVFEALQDTEKIVVADIYDPMHLEQLEQARELPAATWDKQVADATATLNEQLARADFLLCASERQRFFYLGQLAALGRINPANYADDPDLTGLIDIVPFGLDRTPPEHRVQVLKGVHAGIGADDKVLLWSGGLYNWFDPKALIRAVAELARSRPSVRLFFQGTKHPHPGVPEMAIVSESRALAADLGVLDASVFFNDSWVDYSERQNFLTEADAGVSTHFSHVETTFSFRTRILDYLWAELPMVVTEGDTFAELVAEEGLGIVVPSGDVEALATALERILFDEEFISRSRDNIRRVRERFFWENTLAPLVDFVQAPHRAADLLERRLASNDGSATVPVRKKRRKPYGFRHNVRLVRHHLSNGGVRVVLQKVRNRLRRR